MMEMDEETGKANVYRPFFRVVSSFVGIPFVICIVAGKSNAIIRRKHDAMPCGLDLTFLRLNPFSKACYDWFFQQIYDYRGGIPVHVIRVSWFSIGNHFSYYIILLHNLVEEVPIKQSKITNISTDDFPISYVPAFRSSVSGSHSVSGKHIMCMHGNCLLKIIYHKMGYLYQKDQIPTDLTFSMSNECFTKLDNESKT
eukprot:jgi/Galph1/16/GphlegSOOS_G70.1